MCWGLGRKEREGEGRGRERNLESQIITRKNEVSVVDEFDIRNRGNNFGEEGLAIRVLSNLES